MWLVAKGFKPRLACRLPLGIFTLQHKALTSGRLVHRNLCNLSEATSAILRNRLA